MADNSRAVGCAVRTTHEVDNLPAIPTQNWVAKCAQALTEADDRAAVICMVCTFAPDSDRMEVLSTGVSMGSRQTTNGARDQRAIAIQDRCERFTRLGFAIPKSALEQGLIAPLETLDGNWSTSALGRLLIGAHISNPLIQIIPVTPGSTGLCLVCIVGFTIDDSQPNAQRTLHLLRELNQPLSMRAFDALAHVTNPRAWLTDREQGVLELLIEGHSVRVIAERLGRSAHTVHDHVKNLHKKIGASSRGELIAKALGHRQENGQTKAPNPIVLPFPGDQLAEIKPAHVSARPLHH